MAKLSNYIEKPKVETPKKEPALTIAKVFQTEAQKGAKSRKILADNIMAVFAKKGIKHNKKGKEIKVERVLQQISAMKRDIDNDRGAKGGSWWSTFIVVENETDGFKLVPKE